MRWKSGTDSGNIEISVLPSIWINSRGGPHPLAGVPAWALSPGTGRGFAWDLFDAFM